MKKIALSLALILFILPITAHAATPRAITIVPSINFVGDTANCSVYVTANSMNDNITAVIKLWDGGNCIGLWTGGRCLNFKATQSTMLLMIIPN